MGEVVHSESDGGVVTIKPGSKKSVTDSTSRFAVQCVNGTGECRAKYDGTVR